MNRPRTRITVFWIYTALLLALVHIPSSALVEIDVPFYDKYGHFIAFGLWTLLLLRSGMLYNVRSDDVRSKAWAIWALFWSAAFAVGTELLQFNPVLNRTPDLLDVLADVLGSACAVCAVWITRRRQKTSASSD